MSCPRRWQGFRNHGTPGRTTYFPCGCSSGEHRCCSRPLDTGTMPGTNSRSHCTDAILTTTTHLVGMPSLSLTAEDDAFSRDYSSR
ncbi:hypothetical protein BV20DRAFT_580742 [Pilatotrama ljubarskyi]|nr:hypothetical protein BV20DRAFT_580742 [Pilatotrama ljubarskyi]